MSDARWLDIEAAVASSIEHFSRAVEIFGRGNMQGMDTDAYLARMGFMHAMQAAHTSLEASLLRILDVVGEEHPTGQHWHADLVHRVSRPTEARPALVPADLAHAIDETRRFRNIAMRAYESFEQDRAKPAVAAASIIVADLPGAISRFRAAIDP